MSLRDVYEAVSVEMNKENAPNILLEDFNMFVNKAISQYVNKRYNIYEINQQVTDDLNSLKGTAIYTFNYLPDSEGSDKLCLCYAFSWSGSCGGDPYGSDSGAGLPAGIAVSCT